MTAIGVLFLLLGAHDELFCTCARACFPFPSLWSYVVFGRRKTLSISSTCDHSRNAVFLRSNRSLELVAGFFGIILVYLMFFFRSHPVVGLWSEARAP